jgi:hypothetical protein
LAKALEQETFKSRNFLLALLMILRLKVMAHFVLLALVYHLIVLGKQHMLIWKMKP